MTASQQTPTRQEIARVGLQFLARVQLNGAETPAFVHVAQLLESIANEPPLANIPPENAESLAEELKERRRQRQREGQ